MQSTASSRRARIAGSDDQLGELIDQLVSISCDGLPRMLRDTAGSAAGFAHTRYRDRRGQVRLSGESVRYGAIVLLGASRAPAARRASLFGGRSAEQFCGELLGRVEGMEDLGDVALLTWAAAELGHPALERSLARLSELRRRPGPLPTVQAAWSLSALVAAHGQVECEAEVRSASERLLQARGASGAFAHHTEPRGLRSHVGCFADQVYPIQALARLYAAVGDASALESANRCADLVCRRQGSTGQWWWHYDHRTGEVVEGYPVYSVHQDSMAPMALLDLEEAGGTDCGDAIRKGLRWLLAPGEGTPALIDEELGLIWRKVARGDPKKLVRGLRAMVSGLQRSARLRWLDGAFPPRVIDYESRPYHLGWILFTWLEP